MKSSIRQLARILVLILFAMPMTSCLVNEHRVGGGPNGIGSESIRQYYLFFGLYRINEADSQRLTRDLTSYEVVTEFSFSDFILTTLLFPLTVTTRSVTVNL